MSAPVRRSGRRPHATRPAAIHTTATVVFHAIRTAEAGDGLTANSSTSPTTATALSAAVRIITLDSRAPGTGATSDCGMPTIVSRTAARRLGDFIDLPRFPGKDRWS